MIEVLVILSNKSSKKELCFFDNARNFYTFIIIILETKDHDNEIFSFDHFYQ